ncbi:MAG: MBL fold metallo-hydrolase [Planctomycetota bacterium]
MPSDWEFTITGCGTSHGNPMWGVPEWWSPDPRDRRRRSGAFLRGPTGQVILFDCGPDLAHQMTDPYRDWDGYSYPTRSINRCDAVLLTHDHADHSHGINDLRHLDRLMHFAKQRLPDGIPIFGHPAHLDPIGLTFPYCFGAGLDTYALSKPALRLVPLQDEQPTVIAGMPVTAVAMEHGPAGRTTGFRCGSMAYLTDLKTLPKAADALLHGLDLLVMSMLRDEPHPTHQNWHEAQAVIRRLRPRWTVLTHMGPEVRYAEWIPRLHHGITMAVDGWTTTVSTR